MAWRLHPTVGVARATCRLALVALALLPAAAPARPQPAAAVPLFELEQGKASLEWKMGDGGQLEATATLQGPILRVVREAGGAKPRTAENTPEKEPRSEQQSALATTLERVAIHDGAVLYVQGALSGRELLSVRDLEMTLENFATERESSGGQPALARGRGRIGREGRIDFSIRALSWSEQLDFSGRAEITGLHLEELAGLVAEQAKLLPSAGTLSAVAKFEVDGGRISGTVEPKLSGVAADWLGSAENWLERRGIDLFGDDEGEGGRKTERRFVLQLHGTVDDPRAGVAAAALAVLEQALVRSIGAALPKLPSGSGIIPGMERR